MIIGEPTAWRTLTAAALLVLVAVACLARHRREARVALAALPLALALVPTLSWPVAALVAGLGTFAATLSLPAQGRSLAMAAGVLGVAVAATGAVALALRALIDAATPALWAPLATLVLVPLVVLSLRRFHEKEAPA